MDTGPEAEVTPRRWGPRQCRGGRAWAGSRGRGGAPGRAMARGVTRQSQGQAPPLMPSAAAGLPAGGGRGGRGLRQPPAPTRPPCSHHGPASAPGAASCEEPPTMSGWRALGGGRWQGPALVPPAGPPPRWCGDCVLLCWHWEGSRWHRSRRLSRCAARPGGEPSAHGAWRWPGGSRRMVRPPWGTSGSPGLQHGVQGTCR